MAAPEVLLELYLHLAKASEQQQRFPQQETFLALAANFAWQAGDDRAAEACRSAILRANPGHVLCNFGSMREAIDSCAVVEYTQTLVRLYPFEKAEYLLDKYRSAGYRSEHGFELECGPPEPMDGRNGLYGMDPRDRLRSRTRPADLRRPNAAKQPMSGRPAAGGGGRVEPAPAFVPLESTGRNGPSTVPLGACIVYVIIAFAIGFVMAAALGLVVR